MARTLAYRQPARPLIEVFDEAIDVVRQDFGEYGYIALIGAVLGCMAVIVPGIIGGPVAAAFTGPLLTLVAVMTLASAAACVACAGDQLQPDAAGAFKAALFRLPGLLWPWLPLMVALGAAGPAFSLGREFLGPVPKEAPLLAIVAVGALFAFPRSLAPTAYIEQDLRSREAERLSMEITRVMQGRLLVMWALLMTPALAVLAVSSVGGLDAVTGAFAALVFVLTLPFAAAVFSPVFADGAERLDRQEQIASRGQVRQQYGRRA